jgi:hypothetical protein
LYQEVGEITRVVDLNINSVKFYFCEEKKEYMSLEQRKLKSQVSSKIWVEGDLSLADFILLRTFK